MEASEREILRRNHYLLIKNIILTEEFYSLLRSYHVLPETMIKDVQAGKSREERNTKLLELLQIRGCDALRKLRHVLVISGHSFLGDVIYEEGAKDNTSFLKGGEIFHEFPAIFNHVSDDVKSKLLKYLDSRVKERSLMNSWKFTPEERDETQESYKTGFEQEKDLRTKLENKQRQARQLFDDTSRYKEMIRKRDVEIEVLKRELEANKVKFKSELSIQAKFNAANNNSIIKLKERFSNFNNKIKQMNAMIRCYFGEDEIAFESDPDNTKLTVLERNLKHALQSAREKTSAANSMESERKAVLTAFNMSSSKYNSISDIVRKYVEKEDKGKAAIFTEIEKLRSLVKSNGFSKPKSKHVLTPVTDVKLLKSIVATLRVEIEHIQKKLQWKDDQITDLLEENAALRQGNGRPSISTTIPPLPSAKSSPYFDSLPSSPDSTIDRLPMSVTPHVPSVTPHHTLITPHHTYKMPRLAMGRHDVSNNKENTGGNNIDELHTDCPDCIKIAEGLPATTKIKGPSKNKYSMHDTESGQNTKDITRENLLNVPTIQTLPESKTVHVLPDINDHRSDMSSRQSVKSLSVDLTKMLETSNDNSELEMVLHLLSKKAEKDPNSWQMTSA
ncbi:hypothetical protein FSP39_003625 [Pinctada imbricata]|uniref:CARD domain-containing protein n=1 Tax=Pinctada imbricata TaxID=66713 RepID=A0AA88YAN2_PINIB|nr:hypothetical protein FSP39_003625 [Pinctada imbricata]